MTELFAALPWLAPLVLVAGFVPLVWGADRLVEGGAALAGRFKVPPLVIGLTIVAFGTSAPELVVNMFSATSGSTELALGNIVGSNVFNILGILGVAALIYPLTVRTSTTWMEIPLVMLSAGLILVMALDAFWGDPVNAAGQSMLSRADGLVLLFFFAIFLAYTYNLSKQDGPEDDLTIKDMTVFVSTFWVVVGLACLVLGGKMIVDGAVEVARGFGVAERVIGLTIVAIGTSLPELATSVVAALKKQTDIAVGNVVGSNIFNVFFILGLTAAISPVPIKGPEIADLWVNLGVSVLIFAFVFLGKGRKISRPEGGIMLACYVGYVAWLLLQG